MHGIDFPEYQVPAHVPVLVRHLPWNYYDRSADHVRRAHWDRWRPLLYSKAGLPMPPALPLEREWQS